jgi:Uma2 family endonuclease
MATNPTRHITPEEYLAIERTATFKSEYFNGEVFAMAGAQEPHVLLVTNLVAELRTKLRRNGCRVYSTDMRVCVSPTGQYVYPDLTVVCSPPIFLDSTLDTLTNPQLIIEVLSPTTQDYDRGGKFTSYRTIPSFQEYLTVASDEIHIEQHVRKEKEGGWFLTDHTNVSGNIPLHSIGIDLMLADIYDGITFESEGV